MGRFIELVEKVLLALIGKLNIVTIMLLLVLLGYMNQDSVFTWFGVIGRAFKGLLP